MGKKDQNPAPRATGPRGGKTTVTNAGLHKKTIYVELDEWRALRRKAADDDSSANDVVRKAIRAYLGIKEP